MFDIVLWYYLEQYGYVDYYFFFFDLGFTPCKAEQPSRGMELQQKEPTVRKCLLILDLKPFRS